MHRKVIIVGAGGHGKVVADIAEKSGDAVIGFLDDKAATELPGVPIIGRVSDIPLFSHNADAVFALGIGGTAIRKRIMEQFDASWYTAIHPSAVIGNDVEIGPGTVIAANAVVNSGSRIGRGVIINTAATADHDNVIGDYVHLSPGAHLGGSVSVGMCTWIGIGACVRNNTTICAGCTVGMGAVILTSIDECGTYVGVPARRIP